MEYLTENEEMPIPAIKPLREDELELRELHDRALGCDEVDF